MIFTDAQARFFNQQLEHIISEMYKVQYADLIYRQIFPVSFGTPAGSQTVVRRHLDHRGKAQWINNHATDLPRVDVSAGETRYPVKECGDSFGYTFAEIRRGALTGVSLQQERADAARRKIEEEMNDATFNGVADLNLPGLFTNTDIDTDVLPNGAAASPLWVNKTPDEILKDVNATFSAVDVNTLQIEKPTKLGLPPVEWNRIFTTPRASGSDLSIATWLVANCPWLDSTADIVKIRELTGSGAAGVNELLVFPYDPKVAIIEIPMDVTVHEPERRNLEYVVPVTAEFSSLHIMRPKAFRFGSGL
jgi:hypothetical protein